ncbi:hypothetical protein OQZ33_03960 [Pedobacter sp. MC2016-05]|nr:hypothetical protein [Pedobacter sp. MC2016-05]
MMYAPKYINRIATALIIWFLMIPPALAQLKHAAQIIDPTERKAGQRLILTDADAKVVDLAGKSTMRLFLGHKAERAKAEFSFPPVDLSQSIGISITLKNFGAIPVAIEAQCSDANNHKLTLADGAKFYYRSMIILEPGETDTLLITLSRSADSLPSYIGRYFKGMYGLPGGYVRRKENLNLKRITNISIFKTRSQQDCDIGIIAIRATGNYSLPSALVLSDSFFPFLDDFGQYRHNDWSGKVKSVQNIYDQKYTESAELLQKPSPRGWDKYGGWGDGPTLHASGHFRVEKYQGKWWLVDPLGKLFWSNGINIVSPSQRTPTVQREHYFTHIPPDGDFLRANLVRKYAQPWSDQLRDTIAMVTHQRLRSWGVNTMAANSDPYLYHFNKTPYTIEIRSGISNPLPDSINRQELRRVFAQKLSRQDIALAVNDPWCIGFFVDNELGWPVKHSEEAINDYFSTIQQVLDSVAPDKLYLGCRTNSPNFSPTAFKAAAKYCDVISINYYDYNVSDFNQTDGMDRPIIIGEYHFGALDRGLPHPGLRAVSNQTQRSRVYAHFLNQAIKDPRFVGAHWFQYSDQVYSARNDGENYQIGFVDICDRPYPEMINAARNISATMYNRRLKDY